MNQLITEDERKLLLEHGRARAAGRGAAVHAGRTRHLAAGVA